MEAGTIFAIVLILIALCILGFSIYDTMGNLDDAKYVIMATDNQRDNDIQAITSQFKDINDKVDTMNQSQETHKQLLLNNINTLQTSVTDTSTSLKQQMSASIQKTSKALGNMPSQINTLQTQMSNVQDPTKDFVKNNIIATRLKLGADVNMYDWLNSSVMEVANANFAFRDDGTMGTGTKDPQMGLDINNKNADKLGLKFTDTNSKKFWQMRMKQSKDIDGSLMFSADTSNASEPKGVMTLARSGFVGIGTPLPSATLDVHGNMNITNDVNAGSLDFDLGYMTLGGNSNTNTILKASGNNSVFVLSDKNSNVRVGVGQSVPLESLHVTGNILASGSNIQLGGVVPVLTRDSNKTTLSDSKSISFGIGTGGAGGFVTSATMDGSNVTLNTNTKINGNLNVKSSDPSISTNSIQLGNYVIYPNPDKQNQLSICQTPTSGTAKIDTSTCKLINTT